MRVSKVSLIDGLYLVGTPGIGKTETVKELAEEEAKKMGKTFVDLREADNETLDSIFQNPEKYYVFIRVSATHIFPEDFQIPAKNTTNNAKYYEQLPPKIFAVLSLPNIYGVLFIDELNNVQREDQLTALFSLILEKEIAWNVKLSKNVKIISAGNPPELSNIANPLPLPMRMGRLAIVHVDPPTIDDWINYMNRNYGDKWEKMIAGYLKFFSNDFIRLPNGEDDGLTPYPSPRSWTKLALQLYELKNREDINDEFIENIIYSYLGNEVGTKVYALINSSLTQKEVEELLSNPSEFDSLNEAKKIFILNMISNDPLRFKNLAKYIAEKNHDYMVITIVMMNSEAKKKMLEDKDYKEILMKLINIIKDYI